MKGSLGQLRREELLRIAKSKNIKIPERMSKSAIVQLLSLNISAKDVQAHISTPLKARTEEGKGFERTIKGKQLEEKVASIFKKQGFECETNERIAGAEFDVTGKKKGGFFSDDKWVFVECKNKSSVAPIDFKKFIGNLNVFRTKNKISDENIEGYLYTTGVFDKDTMSQARKFKNITLKRVRL